MIIFILLRSCVEIKKKLRSDLVLRGQGTVLIDEQKDEYICHVHKYDVWWKGVCVFYVARYFQKVADVRYKV